MTHALNALTLAQVKGTKKNKEEMIHFLNYCTTHPEAKVRFKESNKIQKFTQMHHT